MWKPLGKMVTCITERKMALRKVGCEYWRWMERVRVCPMVGAGFSVGNVGSVSGVSVIQRAKTYAAVDVMRRLGQQTQFPPVTVSPSNRQLAGLYKEFRVYSICILSLMETRST
jgi:hypothetical protein